jgi:hypothetical protein
MAFSFGCFTTKQLEAGVPVREEGVKSIPNNCFALCTDLPDRLKT